MKVKAYILSLLATAFPNALGFLAFPLYAKALGAENYGVIALLEACLGMLSMLLFCGMTTAFYVFFSQAKDDNERSSVFTVNCIFTLIIAVVVSAIALFSSQISEFLFQKNIDPIYISIYAFAIFSDYLLTLANTYLRIKGNIAFLAYNAIIISLFQHGACLVALIGLKGDVFTFITIFFASKMLACLLALFHLVKAKIPLLLSPVTAKLFKTMVCFGAPLVLTSLTGWVLLLSDRFFINYYASTADVGVYAVGYKFAMGLWIGIVQPFMIVWEPSLLNVYNSDKNKGYAMVQRDFTRYLAGIVVLYSFFILFIGDVLELLFANSEYTEEGSIVYLLVGSYFLMAIGEMAQSVCRLNKTSSYALFVSAAAMGAKIAFNFILIPKYLLIGAAIASVVAELMAQFIIFGFVKRLTKGYNLFFYMRNALLIFAFIGSQVFILFFPDGSLVLKGTVFLILLCGAIFLTKVRTTRLQLFHQPSLSDAT